MTHAQDNPYAPPRASGVAPGVTEHEPMRRAHINTETNIKSIGSLALFGGVINAVGGIMALGEAPIDAAIALAIAGIALAAGVSLRRLAPRGRVLYTVLAALVLLANIVRVLLIGAVVGAQMVGIVLPLVVMGLFLSILWGAKGGVVFSEHYRDVVIPATPHVKYKTSKVAIALLVLLVVVFIAAIVRALNG